MHRLYLLPTLAINAVVLVMAAIGCRSELQTHSTETENSCCSQEVPMRWTSPPPHVEVFF